MATERREVKRLGIFSLLKTCFIVGGLTGFVIGCAKWAFMGMILHSLGRSGYPFSEISPEIADIISGGLGMLGLLFPILGTVGGAIGGAVIGLVSGASYNFGAKLWGGLELELAVPEETRAPSTQRAAAAATETPLPAPLPRPPVQPPPGPSAEENPPRPSFE